ncbi:pantoate--beta-alanine ligase, partial [Rhizobium sp. BR5]
EAAIEKFIAAEKLASPEVVAVRDPDTLAPVASLQAGPVLVALFVRVGST